MPEVNAVDPAVTPRTRESLAHDLGALGLAPGMTVIVHSSLRSLGWVCGGSVAVVQALIDVVTQAGTIVMPTHTTDNSDPEPWQAPPVPESWWQIIRDHTPAFDPTVTPTRKMGRIVETFRTWPGALRSNHPQASFAAWGCHAAAIIAHHSLAFKLGEGSPLRRMYNLGGSVLLLGVGHDSNTSLHLAEYRAHGATMTTESAALLEHGQRVWRTFPDIELDSDQFPALVVDYLAQGGAERTGLVGSAPAILVPQRPLIDFGVNWLNRQRGNLTGK
jgi:aminoglycoside 3-N-acetyltransferase